MYWCGEHFRAYQCRTEKRLFTCSVCTKTEKAITPSTRPSLIHPFPSITTTTTLFPFSLLHLCLRLSYPLQIFSILFFLLLVYHATSSIFGLYIRNIYYMAYCVKILDHKRKYNIIRSWLANRSVFSVFFTNARSFNVYKPTDTLSYYCILIRMLFLGSLWQSSLDYSELFGVFPSISAMVKGVCQNLVHRECEIFFYKKWSTYVL